MKSFYLFIFIISFQISYSQSTKSYGEIKAEVFNYIKKAEDYKKIPKSEALKVCDKGIIQAQKIGDKKSEAKLLYLKAQIFDFYEEYESSYIIYKHIFPKFLVQKDSVSAAKCCLNIGVFHYYNGNYDSAIIAYKNAEIFLRYSTYLDLKSKIYNNLGLTYKSKGNYKSAISSYQNVINLYNYKSQEKSLAMAYLNIGTIYWDQENLEMALKYFNESLKVFEALNKLDDMASVYNNLALIYNGLGDSSQAIHFYDKAINIYSEVDNKKDLAITFSNKAVLLDKYGYKKEAELLFLQALKIYELVNYDLGIFSNRLNLSQLYSEFGDKHNALKYALAALNMKSVDRPLKYVAEGNLILANTYSELGQFKLANDYFKKYIQIKDSFFTLENSNLIAEIQTKYENEKVDAQLKIYKQTIRIQNLEIVAKRKQILYIYWILILSLAFVSIFSWLYYQKRRSYMVLVHQNVKLAEIDLDKERKIQELDSSWRQNPKVESLAKEELEAEKTLEKPLLLQNLIQIMEEEKPYLQPQIVINDLVKRLGTNRNYLSQIINDNFDTNFNNFINEYRVKEARKLILKSEYQQYTIEAIGQIVGFHSKASFNSAFKKFTGVTPSFFRTNYKKL